MHLSAIRLKGFKSFPDPVEVRLEPGVAVVVGPNGSGKSNVGDAIVWAAGSLSPHELRAEKPDDVLFSGSASRQPADFCEVELLFDNADGEGPFEWSEVSIARRLHRGGEGQYLLNRNPVRRLDLVEVLADVGLGGGMHSIIGQGRVEEILGSKPESLLGERNRVEEELADAAGKREQATAALYRLRTAGERVAMRRESAEGLLTRLRDDLERPRRVLDERVRAEREALEDRVG